MIAAMALLLSLGYLIPEGRKVSCTCLVYRETQPQHTVSLMEEYRYHLIHIFAHF